MRTRMTFSEVSLTGRKTVKCGCGKSLRRQKRFYQTLNPFNKNPDGTIKTTGDIINALEAEIVEWKKLPETCAGCRKVK